MARKPSLTSLLRDAPTGAAPSAAPRARRRSKNANAVSINLKHSKNAAEIVRTCAEQFGWRETATTAEDCNANVFWYERAITVAEVKPVSYTHLTLPTILLV